MPRCVALPCGSCLGPTRGLSLSRLLSSSACGFCRGVCDTPGPSAGAFSSRHYCVVRGNEGQVSVRRRALSEAANHSEEEEDNITLPRRPVSTLDSVRSESQRKQGTQRTSLSYHKERPSSLWTSPVLFSLPSVTTTAQPKGVPPVGTCPFSSSSFSSGSFSLGLDSHRLPPTLLSSPSFARRLVSSIPALSSPYNSRRVSSYTTQSTSSPLSSSRDVETASTLFSSSESREQPQQEKAEGQGKEEEEDFFPQKGHVGPRPVYLDYQATTVVDPRVTDAMLPFMYEKFGNPHSSSHSLGWEAGAAVEHAREQVASVLGLPANRAREIIFTSGATESNNLAIKGAVHYYCKQNSPVSFNKNPKNKDCQARPRRHIITTQLEHKCALQCCRMLQLRHKETNGLDGCEVTFLPVKSDGLVDLAELESAIRPDTLLVSVMHVNNEIGVMQDLQAIGGICRKRDVLFHTDAAQSAGKVPIDVDKLGVDLLSVSGHKIYGPKGIGALFVRAHKPRVRLQPIIDGGGQERGLRSGTLATPLCVGLGAACELALNEMENDSRHVSRLSNLLLDIVREKVPDIEVNGSLTHRYPGNLNISFTFVEGESLIMSVRDVAVSSGSACTSASLEPSYVLRALGVGEEVAHTSLRFGFGRFTTEEEVRRCAERLVKQIHRLRELSPLYELEMTKRRAMASGVSPTDETEGSGGFIWT